MPFKICIFYNSLGSQKKKKDAFTHLDYRIPMMLSRFGSFPNEIINFHDNIKKLAEQIYYSFSSRKKIKTSTLELKAKFRFCYYRSSISLGNIFYIY